MVFYDESWVFLNIIVTDNFDSRLRIWLFIFYNEAV